MALEKWLVISNNYLLHAENNFKRLNLKNNISINYKDFYDCNFSDVKLIYSMIVLQYKPPFEIKKNSKQIMLYIG